MSWMCFGDTNTMSINILFLVDINDDTYSYKSKLIQFELYFYISVTIDIFFSLFYIIIRYIITAYFYIQYWVNYF